MALGNDHTAASAEFVEAMRARLEAQEEGLGKNVDLPEVKKNLEALGTAVFRIATVKAETRSDAVADPSYWAWVASVNSYLKALQAWQTGMTQAVQAWAPKQPAEVQLRTKILALPSPGTAPAAPPSSLRGGVR